MDGLQINLLQITRTLEGVNFPAKKDDLLKRAEESGADENVLNALQGLPDRTYNTVDEINKELGQEK